MVLDLLQFKQPSGCLPGRWGWLRYLHFGNSLGVVLLLFFAAGFRNGATGATAVIWFILGNLTYYALDIGLAYALKDNRAFYTYLPGQCTAQNYLALFPSQDWQHWR